MKLWIDDQLNDPETPSRHVPKGWIGAASSAEAIALVQEHGLPTAMDLDHDLGGEDTVMVFLKWLAGSFPNGPIPDWTVHSRNGEGIKSVYAYLNSWQRSLGLP